MSNCCTPHPDGTSVRIPTKWVDTEALSRIVEWSKAQTEPPAFPRHGDPLEKEMWDLNTAYWWMCDITIRPRYVLVYLVGRRSAHTFRDMGAFLGLLGSYMTENITLCTHLMDVENPKYGYEEMHYKIGPSEKWTRVNEDLLKEI